MVGGTAQWYVGVSAHLTRSPWQLVLGKFFACLLLVGVALLLTLPLPITVAFIGNLDWGPVFGGYLATLFLAAAYIAIGLFVSARSDNQIISLIITSLLCGLFYLLGADALTGLFGNRGSELLQLLGTTSIVTVGFSLFEAEADSGDWIDNKILKLDEKKIVRAEFPGFTLQRQDGEWQLAQLAPDEKVITDQVEELVKKLDGLTVESVFTSGDEPELEENTKPLKITVVLDDDSRLEYTFSKLKGGSGYLLQRSDQSMRYKIADWGVNPLKDTEREKLVEIKSPAD